MKVSMEIMMKRSEFLKSLYDRLDYVQFYPENQHKNYVDIVIQEAEKMGLIPQYVIPVTYDDLTVFKTVEGWEPED